MTRPTLFVERFMVLRDDKTVFDQPFHKGVNIIRGENSTGKSTVMDLLYYALGGELKEWTEEQELCTHVLVEVSLLGRTFCLKRETSLTGKAAMHFFEGDTETALQDSKNWFRYPNQRSDSKHSYSEQLFDIMGLPQHKTEFSNNLTMHQILRLIYVDQLTDTTKLLNNEPEWDNAVTRKAIGEYLLSIDDLEAHKLRQQLIAANKVYESINGELTAITRVLRREDQVFEASRLKADLAEAHKEIARLESSQKEVRLRKLENLAEEVQERSSGIVAKIESLAAERRRLVDEKASATAERLDTMDFLESVKERLTSLEHSTITRQEFGDVGFEYCPSCLTKLDENIPEDTCKLCKQDHSSSSRDYAVDCH